MKLNNEKYDCVVVLGCSFMHGDQIMMEGGKFIGHEYRMSKLLADKLKCDEINLSHSGGSNERIFRELYHWVDSNSKYKNPLIIMGLRGLSRTQLYSNVNERYFDLHIFDFPIDNRDAYNTQLHTRSEKLLGKGVDIKLLENWNMVYGKYFWNEKEEVIKLERNIMFIDSYLKQRNIDYLVLNSIQDNLPNIKNKISYLSFDLDDYINDYEFPMNDINGSIMKTTPKLDDCWYHYLRIQHELEYGNFDSGVTRNPKPPYGKYFCNGHPSADANKHLTEMIYEKI
jgi:hypothetical protein